MTPKRRILGPPGEGWRLREPGESISDGDYLRQHQTNWYNLVLPAMAITGERVGPPPGYPEVWTPKAQ